MPVVSDPAGAHYFALELEGVEIAWFLGCSGIKSTAEVFELEEGGLNDRVHRLPGPSRWDNVVLRRATQVSEALWSWREACLGGDHDERRSGAVTLYAPDGSPVSRFELMGLWPVRWSGPGLDGGGSDLAVEELEVAVHEVRVL